jgi:hypothetical protein
MALMQSAFASLVANSASLKDISFTPVKVANILQKLKASKSAGPDGNPSIFFEQLAHVLAEPMSLIYAAFMSGCRMPQANLSACSCYAGFQEWQCC